MISILAPSLSGGFVQAAQDAKHPPEKLIFSTKHGWKAQSRDGNYKFRINGQVMVDAAFYHDDGASLDDGVALRRARLALKGALFHDWRFKTQVGFAGNKTRVKDAYLRYTGFKAKKITAGVFKTPFSLEDNTSSKYITFMERALPVMAFAPGRKTGLALQTRGDYWSAAGGVFGESVPADSAGGKSWGVAGRATLTPLHRQGRRFHVGGSLEYRKPDDARKVRFRTTPESDTADVKLVDTGKIKKVDNTFKYGLEAVYTDGPWSFQGEYLNARVKRGSGRPDLDFSGWYVYGSWFITGESRSYNIADGSFRRIKPKRSKGAWEAGMRFSSLDLNDRTVRGGEENNLTIGLNWYPNRNMRFMANYIAADVARQNDKQRINIIQFRSQIVF